MNRFKTFVKEHEEETRGAVFAVILLSGGILIGRKLTLKSVDKRTGMIELISTTTENGHPVGIYRHLASGKTLEVREMLK